MQSVRVFAFNIVQHFKYNSAQFRHGNLSSEVKAATKTWNCQLVFIDRSIDGQTVGPNQVLAFALSSYSVQDITSPSFMVTISAVGSS
jgi:hypothetical protein